MRSVFFPGPNEFQSYEDDFSCIIVKFMALHHPNHRTILSSLLSQCKSRKIMNETTAFFKHVAFLLFILDQEARHLFCSSFSPGFWVWVGHSCLVSAEI